MFARALEDFDKNAPPKPKSASPLQFSKAPAQPSIQTSFKQKSASGIFHRKSDILKPTPASKNKNPPYRPIVPQATSQQQSHNQQNDLTKTFNNPESSFRENITPPAEPSYGPPARPIDALHDAVYFTEADFDDDNDLDFEISQPILPAFEVAAAAIPSPASSDQKGRTPPTNTSNATDHAHAQPPPSSIPIPWSSSPVEHKITTTTTNSALEQALKPQEEVTVQPPLKKRRPLPPGYGSVKAKTESSNSSTKAAARKASDNVPWNGLAAESMKEGKKEARKGNKQPNRTVETGLIDPHEQKKATKSKARPAHIFLSEEQKQVVKLVVDKKASVFFTGAAGTGKSVLLRELIATLKKKYKKDADAVAVTASTGLAACNIGGVTLHSFAGIGLGKESLPDLVRKIKRNPKARNRWIRTKVLIMDEVSMVDGDLYDKLEAIARQIRNNGRVFGGIQIVITGDFFQLPPVPDSGKTAKFAFDALTWNTSITHTIGLTQVFRQRDPEFARMLNEMRLGYLCEESCDTFKKLGRPLVFDDGIQATELFSTRGEVDGANAAKMRQLKGNSTVFPAEDTGTQDKQFRDKLLQSCMAPASIELKINSQVMLIKNIDETLVNGSLGRVVGFLNEKTFDHLNEAGELEAAFQGDDEDVPLAMREIRNLAKGGGGIDTARRWPLVQFAMPDGTSRQLLVQPETWKVELPNGEVQAQRSQIPLILAWALSIHKAQGQTLERVKVDLGKVFEKGQAYVALSRATCKEGLQVLRFDEKKVMAHEKVRVFYQNLSNAQDAIREAEEAAKAKRLGGHLVAKVAKGTKRSSAVYEEDDDEAEMARAFG